MRILIDPIIYTVKDIGGIRRYFDSYLPLLNKIDQEVKVEMLSKSNFNRYTIKGDIFHSTYYTRYPDNKIHQVVTVYDMIHEKFPRYFPGIKNYVFRKRKRKIVEIADTVICISQNTKKDLLRFYKLKPEKVFVVYPGVDKIFKKITNLKVKKNFLLRCKLNKPYFLYVGQRGRYKNFLRLVQAFSEWENKDDFNLVCVGGPDFHRQREINYFKQLNLKDKIYHFAQVKDKDLVLFYNFSHAFIYPSLYEGFGMPLLEAMACGTLILCSNRSSFPEVVKDGGIYFDPGSLTSMAKVLRQSLNNNLKIKLVKKGQQRARSFSWKKTAQQTLEIYKRLNQ